MLLRRNERLCERGGTEKKNLRLLGGEKESRSLPGLEEGSPDLGVVGAKQKKIGANKRKCEVTKMST